jgi:hypothetical protein
LAGDFSDFDFLAAGFLGTALLPAGVLARGAGFVGFSVLIFTSPSGTVPIGRQPKVAASYRVSKGESKEKGETG